MSDLAVIDLTSADGRLVEPEWLARAEPVHRQLRPQIPSDYAASMARVFAGGGRQTVAARGERVVGVAVFRIHVNTFDGLQMYVDDLITDEALRSEGIGRALIAHLAAHAREAGCRVLNLDSGTQRARAHRFYFREGFAITSFHFARPL